MRPKKKNYYIVLLYSSFFVFFRTHLAPVKKTCTLTIKDNKMKNKYPTMSEQVQNLIEKSKI